MDGAEPAGRLERDYDLIAIDKMLPDAPGLLASTRRSSSAFILCLVDRPRLAAMTALIEAGADHVLADDADIEELRAHFLAISRHKGPRAAETAIIVGDFVLDRAAGAATWRGRRIEFGAQHVLFRLFALLIENAGQCVSQDAIWREVWPQSKLPPNPETIQRTVWRLRRLLTSVTGGDHVATVRGAGYRFAAALRPLSERPGDSGVSFVAIAPDFRRVAE